MSTFEADVAILLPGTALKEPTVVAERYHGLNNVLADMSIESFIAFHADSFDPSDNQFNKPYMLRVNLSKDVQGQFAIKQENDRGRAATVRDLTVQKAYDKPLYAADTGLTIVNNPDVSALLKSGAPVVKPVAGYEQILPDLDPTTALLSENMISFRAVCFGGSVIGMAEYRDAIVYPDSPKSIRKDYLNFVEPSQIPLSMHAVFAAIHETVAEKGNVKRSVLAVNLLTGIDAQGQPHNYFKVLDKPLRISRWDLQFPSTSHTAVTEMAQRWDEAEAQLLADVVNDTSS